jgi:RimJ/RimL family protein N-acetyltransferase
MPVPLLSLIRWQALAPEVREAVRQIRIDQQQIEYAGTLEKAIASCESSAEEDVAGLAIILSSCPVGFVVLSRGSKRPKWAPSGAVALTAMRIALEQQGKGLGRQALLSVDRWIAANWSASEQIALCVDDQNEAGKRAYLRAGFTEYASPEQGRIGLVRYMSKPLLLVSGA